MTWAASRSVFRSAGLSEPTARRAPESLASFVGRLFSAASSSSASRKRVVLSMISARATDGLLGCASTRFALLTWVAIPRPCSKANVYQTGTHEAHRLRRRRDKSFGVQVGSEILLDTYVARAGVIQSCTLSPSISTV